MVMADVLYRLDTRSSIASSLVKIAALLPAAAVAIIPAFLLLAAGPDTLDIAREHPFGALVVVVGLGSAGLLALVPIVRLVGGLGLTRTVTVTRQAVEVVETSWLGRDVRRRRLASIDGVAHVVTTSLSTSHHALVLVDGSSGETIAFVTAPRLDRAAIDAALTALGLPEIASKELRRGSMGLRAKSDPTWALAGRT
jgi:hypothetical protein